MVFHLSSRQSEGLLRSLFALMKLDNDVPDHTTISRRKAKLGKVPFYQDKAEDAVAHLDRQQRSRCPRRPAAQSTKEQGLSQAPSVCRRADWRSRRRRADEQKSPRFIGGLHRLSDRSTVPSHRPELTPHTTPAGVYEAIENHSAHRSPRVLIPPRKGAQLASGPASSRQRNRNIAAQARLGKRKWHTESGYSKRSKVETTFHRYKAIVGSAMRARGLAAQRVEARIGCKNLNTMTALGMPDSEMIG